MRLFLQKKLFHVSENIYPLDSIKEGADEPVANDRFIAQGKQPDGIRQKTGEYE